MSIIQIPIKPLSVNEAWAGRRFKSKKYKQYEKDIDFLIRNQSEEHGEFNVIYTFFIKNYGRTDIDNLIKPLQDILVKKGYIEDDRKIVSMTVRKIKSKDEKIIVEIQKLL